MKIVFYLYGIFPLNPKPQYNYKKNQKRPNRGTLYKIPDKHSSNSQGHENVENLRNCPSLEETDRLNVTCILDGILEQKKDIR